MKIFTRALAPLVIALLVAGCVAEPQYKDPLSTLQTLPKKDGPYSALTLRVIPSDNTRESMKYLTENANLAGKFGSAGAATDVDPRFLLEEMQRVLNARFKSVSISTATPETDTARADVTMIWDTRVKLGKMSGQSNVVDVSGIFMDADRQVIDTVKGTGSTRVPYPAFTLRARAAMTAGLEDFAKNLDGATKLISVLSGGAPTTGPPPVAPPTPSVTPSTVAPLPRIPSSSQPGTVAPLPSGSSVDPK